jgi:superfamily I DNA and/or RNA helicase
MAEFIHQISKSIKEGRWLNVEYKNANGEITHYWCSIKDIDNESKRFYVDIFNYEKSSDIITTWISLERILNAVVIKGTTYDVSQELINKITSNINDYEWLNYDENNIDVLDYLIECHNNDVDPYSEPADMIVGIDYDVLKAKGEYKLDYTQLGQIFSIVNKNHKSYIDEQSNKQIDLILNIYSIITLKGKYTVAYKRVYFNPSQKILCLRDDETIINKAFLISGIRYSLNYYLDVDAKTFCKEFATNQEYYKKLFVESFRHDEVEDERPYIEFLKKDISINLEMEYSKIKSLYKENQLPLPLKAFFNKISMRNMGRKNYPIALYDNNVNIDQLRVINNAMKNPITYVQGPPGTGKTYTILNVIISAFFNDQTVLMTSNNNKPITSIYDKFLHLTYTRAGKTELVPFPIIRLGNIEEVKKALVRIKELYENVNNINVYENTLDKIKLNQENNLKKLNELLEDYEKRLDAEEELKTLEELYSKLDNSLGLRQLKFFDRINELKEKINSIPNITNDEALKLVYRSDEFDTWIYYSSVKRIKRLNEPKYQELINMLNFNSNDEESLKQAAIKFNTYIKDDKNLENFLKVFPIIATTNMSVIKLGSPKVQFDLTIMDEAGQCAIATSLPALLRGESLLLVGDQNQLQPVVVLDTNLNNIFMKKYSIKSHFNYCDNSILKCMCEIDDISKFILMRYHYRCHKKIIDFSNKKYYNGQLICKTLTHTFTNDQLQFLSVNSNGIVNQERNIAKAEAEAIIKKIKDDKLTNVGIITPFRNQAELIQKLVDKEELKGVEVGTIHTFQGQDKDSIILSCAITPNTNQKTFEWVKNNKELINVGVTRAKEKLIIVGNEKEIDKKSNDMPNDLLELVDYVKTNGTSEVNEKDSSMLTKKLGKVKPLNSKAENDFLDTLVQILSINNIYKVKEKIKGSSVIENCQIEDRSYFLSCEFDFVIYDRLSNLPVLVIELNGEEHYTSEEVIKRDKKKEALTKNNIQMISIPNSYSRKYQFLKKQLISILED